MIKLLKDLRLELFGPDFALGELETIREELVRGNNTREGWVNQAGDLPNHHVPAISTADSQKACPSRREKAICCCRKPVKTKHC